MRILLINAFHGGSHKAWADAIVKYSKSDITLVTLPGKHWKWRMHGAAIQLSLKLAPADQFDLLLTTDMIDLATLRGIRPDLASLKTVVYFHENQLTYPWSPDDPDKAKAFDRRYGWINYTTALAADERWFASSYHEQVLAEALPRFLKAFPEGAKLPLPSVTSSRVMSFPLEISVLAKAQRPKMEGRSPVIIWNHRWEYDKGPEAFFSIVDELADEGLAFSLIILGEAYARAPEVFAKARVEHADRILHWGFAESKAAYQSLLLQGDIALVTSMHDFFGISVVEAIAAGAAPVLPARLGNDSVEAPYASHLSEKDWAAARYENRAACLRKVRDLILAFGVSESGDPGRDARRLSVCIYDAQAVVAGYDAAFSAILAD